ncbi:MAG: hypothetical protein ABEJ90_01275 [Halobacterium sp.]
MPLRWLAEDDDHPVRPDLPVFRHLTFTEVHSLELGAYVGLLVFFAVQAGAEGQAVTLLIAIVRFTMSDGRAKAGATKVTHRLGFHDVRQEPPYFGAGVLLAYGLITVATRVWMLVPGG